MSLEYPDDLKYIDSHEYVRVDGEIATIGVSAFAVDQMGEIVFLELPEEGYKLEKGEPFGNIESVKAVEDLKAPLSGTVIECNQEVVDAPELLNNDPYTEGWLVKIRADSLDELDDVMSAEEYRAQVEGE